MTDGRTFGASSKHLSASGQVKTAPGFVSRVVIDSPAATANRIKLYDALSATGTAVFDLEFQAPANRDAITLELGFEFKTGLYAALTNGGHMNFIFS